MIFIVRHEPYSNRVDVKLAYDTTDKIKKVLLWCGSLTIVGASTLYIIRDKKKTAESSE